MKVRRKLRPKGFYKAKTEEQRNKRKARWAVQVAVWAGLLKRLPCEVCGNPDSHGHHHNGYDQAHAVDVRWLCEKHHKQIERQEKSKLTKKA
jgi:hypothetical protein